MANEMSRDADGARGSIVQPRAMASGGAGGAVVSLAALQAAETVVRRYFPPTPLVPAPGLSALVGSDVYLKLENTTPLRTFKIRGALNKLAELDSTGVPGGVATASAGNHGMAVAYAARAFGRPATIFVPDGANPQKIAAIERCGGRVVVGGSDYQEAYERCTAYAAEHGLTVVHAYDDPAVIAGQGTVALELMRQVAGVGASAGTADGAAAGLADGAAAGLADGGAAGRAGGGVAGPAAVYVGIGGGGLISGIGAALGRLRPHTAVYGACPEGADALARSVEAGRLVELDRVDTFADGLAARRPGQNTLALAQQHVREFVRVSDEEIWSAMESLLRHEGVVAEPAGAAALAALLRLAGVGRQADSGRSGAAGAVSATAGGSASAVPGGPAVIVVSGANIADAVLQELARRVAER